MLVVCILVYFFGPRYKIAYFDNTGTNYLRTDRGSPGYKDFSGQEKIMWDKTLIILGSTFLLGGIFIFFLRDKDKPKDDKQKNTIRRT